MNVESHGSFAKDHPEKIGTYHLIPSLWINNRPVWMQESEGGSYLRANTFGSWIICKVSFLKAKTKLERLQFSTSSSFVKI